MPIAFPLLKYYYDTEQDIQIVFTYDNCDYILALSIVLSKKQLLQKKFGVDDSAGFGSPW
jgi:hypothetical protein